MKRTIASTIVALPLVAIIVTGVHQGGAVAALRHQSKSGGAHKTKGLC